MALVQLDEDDDNGDQDDDRRADQDPKGTRGVGFDEPEKRGEAEIGGAVDSSGNERNEGKEGQGTVANPNVPSPPWRKLGTKASNRGFDSENGMSKGDEKYGCFSTLVQFPFFPFFFLFFLFFPTPSSPSLLFQMERTWQHEKGDLSAATAQQGL